MNVPVENGELSGNDHLGREGSGIAFCGGNVDFFHILMILPNLH